MNRRKFKRKFGNDKKFVKSMYPNAWHQNYVTYDGIILHYIFSEVTTQVPHSRTNIRIGFSAVNKGMAWRDAREYVSHKLLEALSQ